MEIEYGSEKVNLFRCPFCGSDPMIHGYRNRMRQWYRIQCSNEKGTCRDKLLGYIRSSDFYTAPASTKYHLSCEGGLLQHSLNVLDALRGLPIKENDGQSEDGTPKLKYRFAVAGKFVATVPEESVIITALLHDICKTHFYTVSFRNAKNEKTGKWEKVPYYTVDDKMPLGHGSKSAMIIKQYIELTSPEMYAIWHHMGFTDSSDPLTVGQAIDKYPFTLALQTADMMASHFMEATGGNAQAFADPPAAESAGEYADQPTTGAPDFQEAPPLSEGA